MGLFNLLKEKSPAGTSIALEEPAAPTGRAKSAFFPHTGVPGRHARFAELRNEASDEEHTSPSLVVRSSAKSFTAGARRVAGPQSPVDAPAKAKEEDGSSPKDVHYEAISQFQQMVELYRGSISTVYRAICGLTKRPVIIKAYQKSKMKEKNFLRMEREIRLMRQLDGDESIVQLYNVFEDAKFKYLVMEVCKGGDLFKAMLLRGGKMDEGWVCNEMVAPLLRTLTRIHAQHILHRDIKPENIFLTASQRFKLGDFGLAIQSSLELPYTRSGTLDYLSPEVLANPSCDTLESPKVTRADLKAKGIRPYDEKVDCWAAGVLAYELVVGRPPFEVKDEAKTAAAIMYKNDISLPARYSALWADFVKQALQKNPTMRPTAVQLLEHPWIRSNVKDPTGGFSPQGLDGSAGCAHPALRHSQTMLPSITLTREPAAALRPEEQGEAEALLNDCKPMAMNKLRTSHKKSSRDSQNGSGRLPPSPLSGRTASTFSSSGSRKTGAGDETVKSVSEFTSSSERLSDILVPRESKESKTNGMRTRAKGQASPKGTLSSLQLEASSSSFTALIANAPTGQAAYIDSGDILEESKRRAGGMKIRMQHYFRRQA